MHLDSVTIQNNTHPNSSVIQETLVAVSRWWAWDNYGSKLQVKRLLTLATAPVSFTIHVTLNSFDAET